MRNGIFSKYAARLPQIGNGNSAAPLTLGEGDTPLLPLLNLPRALALPPHLRIFVKVEGANPTGSFKDRGMVVAVAAAAARGIPCVICASTGNTSASAAAYAKRAGLACVVLIPSGKIASGKLAQAVAYGATIIQIAGNFDDAMAAVKTFRDDGMVAVVNSINPMRIQGQKTAAFEVAEALATAPDYHALPVGNAGNITAYWIGYSEQTATATTVCAHCGGECRYLAGDESDGTTKRPIMLGYQAAGAAPFVSGAPVQNPETVATAIRIGNPQSFAQAQAAVAESGGWFGKLSDDDILITQQQLAAYEGIFCEPASAASLAGVIADSRRDKFPAAGADSDGSVTIVCTLTGNGLKDPDIIPRPSVATVAVSDLPKAIAAAIHAQP